MRADLLLIALVTGFLAFATPSYSVGHQSLNDTEYLTALTALDNNYDYLSPVAHEVLVGTRNRGHLLEIGSGSDAVARLLSYYFYDYTSVQPDPVGATIVRDLGRRVIDLSWPETFPDRTYDAVVCSHGLAEIPADQWESAIQKMLRACDRDGVVAIALVASNAEPDTALRDIIDGLPATSSWVRTRHEIITKTADEMSCVIRLDRFGGCFDSTDIASLRCEDGHYHLSWEQDTLVLKPRRVPVHVDMDGGVDDAFAVAYISRDPTLELVGLTAVFGNVDADQAALNCCTVLDQMRHSGQVPIAKGCATPLVASRALGYRWPGHGSNGLGGVDFDASDRVPVDDLHGAQLIIDNSHRYPGMRLLAIGPLTNVALAYLVDPTLPTRIDQLVVMGGSDTLKGNTTPAAEFNFRCDPEAANIVLEGFGGKITLVTWEQTLRTHLGWEWLDEKAEEFLRQIVGPLSTIMRPRGHPIICDLVAAVALAHPEICQGVDLYTQVELDGTLTRGAVVIDWYGRLGEAPNVKVIQAMDDLLYNSFVDRYLGNQ